MDMSGFLQLERLPEIDDLLKLKVSGGGSGFSGCADCYVNENQFESFCANLIGFPRNIGDELAFTSGDSDELSNFFIEFICGDSSGKVQVLVSIVRIESFGNQSKRRYSSSFGFVAEPASLDRFYKQLGRLSSCVGNTAALGKET